MDEFLETFLRVISYWIFGVIILGFIGAAMGAF